MERDHRGQHTAEQQPGSQVGDPRPERDAQQHQRLARVLGRPVQMVQTDPAAVRPGRQRVQHPAEDHRPAGGAGHRPLRGGLLREREHRFEAGERRHREHQHPGHRPGDHQRGRGEHLRADRPVSRVGEPGRDRQDDHGDLHREQPADDPGDLAARELAERQHQQPGDSRPHPPPAADQVGRLGADQPVQADLQRVVADERQPRPGQSGRRVQAAGELGVERGAVLDVPAHRHIPDHQQPQHDHDQQERQWHSHHAEHPVHGGDAADEHCQRGTGRHRRSEQRRRAHRVAGQRRTASHATTSIAIGQCGCSQSGWCSATMATAACESGDARSVRLRTVLVSTKAASSCRIRRHASARKGPDAGVGRSCSARRG